MKLKGYILDIIAIASFLVITLLFWGPLFSNHVLVQTDIQQYGGMASEIKEYREKGERIHWTNSGYAGMPTYLLDSAIYNDSNLPGFINTKIRKLLPGVSAIFLIGLVCFYILMRSLTISHWLSILGSFFFIAGTFSIQSLVAGHNTKMNAYAYAPLILAGLIYLFRKKPWLGVFCLAYGLAAQIAMNHLQITFYTFLICLIYFISEITRAVLQKKEDIWTPIVLSIIGVALAIGVNYNKLYSIYQHADYTIRSGQSAIDKNDNTENNGAYDYATEWSYKPLETLTILIPNLMGGSSSENMGEKSNWFGNQQIPRSLQANPPTYWGVMPFTGGPVYLSAVLIGLFSFGLLFLKQRWKWWILITIALLILLSWGKFSPLYNAFYHGFPFFNKFRTPMMALLMLGLLFPILALKGTDEALNGKHKISINHILVGFGVPAGMVILFGFLGISMYSFEGAIDTQLKDAGFTKELMNQLKGDRRTLLMNDSIRSFFYILLTALSFWLLLKKIIKLPILIGIILAISFLDLFTINRRYLNQKSFVEKAVYENQLKPNAANREILKDNDLHYRVYEISSNPFANALTSYHHKSLGGYHAAKLQSYDDLIINNIANNDRDILNMLNTKYFIGQGEQGQIGFEENTQAYGNAWFVKDIVSVDSESKALSILSQVNLKNTAIVETSELIQIDSLNNSSIQLISYHPEKLTYQSKSDKDGFGVFSEIFYQQKDGDGWHASIDGKEVTVQKTNFLLRGISIPAGDHEIVFEYKKDAFTKRALISKFSSGLLIILSLAFLWFNFIKGRGLKHA